LFNPHLHAIVTDGCFLESGGFRMALWPTLRDLGEAFRHAIFSMLKKEGKITDSVIENMMSWHHSGFHVHIGERIWPEDEKGLENLARYIIRACFSQERMVYIPVTESTDGVAKVIYTAKDGKTRKTFDEWTGWLIL
jgi:hypothetical protein